MTSLKVDDNLNKGLGNLDNSSNEISLNCSGSLYIDDGSISFDVANDFYLKSLYTSTIHCDRQTFNTYSNAFRFIESLKTGDLLKVVESDKPIDKQYNKINTYKGSFDYRYSRKSFTIGNQTEIDFSTENYYQIIAILDFGNEVNFPKSYEINDDLQTVYNTSTNNITLNLNHMYSWNVSNLNELKYAKSIHCLFSLKSNEYQLFILSDYDLFCLSEFLQKVS